MMRTWPVIFDIFRRQLDGSERRVGPAASYNTAFFDAQLLASKIPSCPMQNTELARTRRESGIKTWAGIVLALLLLALGVPGWADDKA